MRLLSFIWCDYCGKRFEKEEEIKSKNYGEVKRTLNPYKSEPLTPDNEYIDICVNCCKQIDEELNDFCKKRLANFEKQFAKNKKIKDVLITSLNAQIKTATEN